MSFKKTAVLLLLLIYCLATAETIKLKDGTELRGTISSRTNGMTRFLHPLLGRIAIPDSALADRVKTVEENDSSRISTLSRRFSITAGWNFSHGTSSLPGGRLGLEWNKNRLWIDEWDLKINARIAKEGASVIDRAGSAVLRYGRSFSTQFYGFLRASVEHDKNSVVEYRLQPTAGAGFWFSDSTQLKTFIEAGAGWYWLSRTGTNQKNDGVLQFRFSLIWSPFSGVELRTDNYLFPPGGKLERLRFETKNSIALKLFKKHLFTLNYDLVLDKSAPAAINEISGYFFLGLEWRS